MNILILCAGYGTRLRPLTDKIPKPLIPLMGRPLIEHQIGFLRGLEYRRLCINAHHLSSQIEAWAVASPVDRVFYETEILGTGGPLWRLWNEDLRDELLVLNGDLVHDVDLTLFVSSARRSGAEFALFCLDRPGINTLRVGPQSQVLGVKNLYGPAEGRPATYGGIAWYSAKALSKVDESHRDVRMFWKQQAQAGVFPAAIEAPFNCFWCDVGTPAGLHEAAFGLLARANGFIPSCNLAGVVLERCICGRDLSIAPGSRLRDCLILDRARLLEAQTISNAVLGEDFVWAL